MPVARRSVRRLLPLLIALALPVGAGLAIAAPGHDHDDHGSHGHDHGSHGHGAGMGLGRQAEPGVFEAFTNPSQEVDLAFSNIGQVAEVMVKPGDRVTAGQVLMRQDDRAELARLMRLEAEADVAARVQIAEQRRDLAKTQAEKFKTMLADGGGSPGSQREYEELVLNAAIAETQILEERRQGRAAEASVQELQVVMDQKLLRSPVDAVVQIVEAAQGEIFGPQTPAIRLVAIDPLEVEALFVPAEVVSQARVGDVAEVRFAHGQSGDWGEWMPATVTFIDPVADKTAGTRRMRLELPNPGDRPAGELVEIRLGGA
jgi:RND family efflux transporter MFP subunit